MKRRFDVHFPWLFSAFDLIASFLSFFLLSWVFQGLGFFPFIGYQVLFSWSIIWILIASLRKDYEIGRTDEYNQTLAQLGGTAIWFVGVIALLWGPLTGEPLRFFPMIGWFLVLVLWMGSYRVGVHMLLRSYRAKGNNYRNAIIVGKKGTSSKLAQVFRVRKDFGINFLGYFDDFAQCPQTKGSFDEFFEQAPDLDLDFIYINEQLEPKLVRKVIDFADENYIKVKMIPGNSLQLEKNLSFSRYGDFFVINVNEIPLDNRFNSFVKRIFDVVFASLVLVFILSWLIPLVGILIKWESRGPIFFIQKRNGINNREFNCLKFRSMTPNDYADTHQAVKNDPRVTRIGSFLRTTSLDEMPQFINVLFGDMSIVGPRPHTIPMNQTFRKQIDRYNSRHKIKPGITGLAQVKGYRGEIENPFQIRSRVRLDSFYINNWSFLLDLRIMVKTIHELLFNRENAY